MYIPSKSEVGYLDAEVAGEGMKVVLDNGETVNWTPPPVKPAVPDMSQIKSLRHYFGRTGHVVYPAWLYHPTEEAILVKNAEEAEKYGVRYRKTTSEEFDAFGATAKWDFDADTKWRVKPQQKRKVDPNHMEGGKFYVAPGHNPALANNQLIESLIPAVAAAVAQSLKVTATAPASIDPAQWEAFLAFQAFQKTTETVNALANEDLPGDDERSSWIAEAERLGMKIDKRWSTERLKSEVQAKAA